MTDPPLSSTDDARASFAVHIDCDNLWIYETEYGVPLSNHQDLLYRQALPDMLELLARWGIKATFFIVGKDLERQACVDFCRLAIGQGHRLGNHSLSHRTDFDKLGAADVRHEIVAAHSAIVAATGQTPIGFRGPGYHINDAILSTLAELGYRYDSSILPGPAGYLMKAYMLLTQGKTGKSFGPWTSVFAKPRPHLVGRLPARIWEYPIATFPVLRLPIHSTFIYTFGEAYLRRAIDGLCRRPWHHIYLLHAIDALAHPAPEMFGGRVIPLRKSLRERMDFLSRLGEQLQGRTVLTEETQTYR